jgi:MoaA/NifB/PqqE/SkfB family radical SAM enzyme
MRMMKNQQDEKHIDQGNLEAVYKKALLKFLVAQLRRPGFIIRVWKIFRNIRENERKRAASIARYGTPVPGTIMFSVTWRCNLKCAGCYAAHYSSKGDLGIGNIVRIIEECMGLGTSVFVIVGGEPLLVKDIIEQLGRFEKGLFFLFTNGVLMDESKVRLLKKRKNILPIISIDGDRDTNDERRGDGMDSVIARSLEMFHRHKLPFGFSTVVNHKNLGVVTSRDWLLSLRKQGAVLGLMIDYVKLHDNDSADYMLNEDDRQCKPELINRRRKDSGIFLLNFPSDEYHLTGCRSAGLGFLHVNADGYVEPCPFSHYAADNVKDKSMIEILQSGFFQRIRETFGNQQGDGDSCLLHKHREEVKKIALETHAVATESIRS